MIVGMNHKKVIRYYNGTDAFYTLYKNGTLEIQNVTVADNYTEYRCDLRTEHDRDGGYIMLLYYENEGKKQCSMAFLAYYISYFLN